jgi:hypothetical protein
MNDLFDLFFGSVILEFMGASLRWVIGAFVSGIRGKKVKSFKAILHGSPRKKAIDANDLMDGILNVFLGYVALILLFMLGYLIYRIV